MGYQGESSSFVARSVQEIRCQIDHLESFRKEESSAVCKGRLFSKTLRHAMCFVPCDVFVRVCMLEDGPGFPGGGSSKLVGPQVLHYTLLFVKQSFPRDPSTLSEGTWTLQTYITVPPITS